jgi:4a-hydroxytetrahydrobiopterin dehydratase
MASEPQFAEGINLEQLRPLLNELQDQGWSLDEEKIGIKKTFYFRSYFKAVVGFLSFPCGICHCVI